MKGICPRCGNQTIIADRVRCADRLWCDSDGHCDFYMVQAAPGFQAVYDKIFPTPAGYNDRMVSLNDRADARLFAGAVALDLAGKRRPR